LHKRVHVELDQEITRHVPEEVQIVSKKPTIIDKEPRTEQETGTGTGSYERNGNNTLGINSI